MLLWFQFTHIAWTGFSYQYKKNPCGQLFFSFFLFFKFFLKCIWKQAAYKEHIQSDVYRECLFSLTLQLYSSYLRPWMVQKLRHNLLLFFVLLKSLSSWNPFWKGTAIVLHRKFQTQKLFKGCVHFLNDILLQKWQIIYPSHKLITPIRCQTECQKYPGRQCQTLQALRPPASHTPHHPASCQQAPELNWTELKSAKHNTVLNTSLPCALLSFSTFRACYL